MPYGDVVIVLSTVLRIKLRWTTISNCRPVRRPRQSVGGTQRNGAQQLSDRL